MFKSRYVSTLINIAFVIVLIYAIWDARLSADVAVLYALMSGVTFIVYAVDKSAAIKKNHRVSENTLHYLALVGGWPGALFAQSLLRHKTQKQPFRRIFWVTIVFNLAVLWGLQHAFGVMFNTTTIYQFMIDLLGF